MFQKKIIIISNSNNQDLAKKIKFYLKKFQKFEVILIKENKNFINLIIESFKKYIYKNKNSKMIIIDEYGILPFMVASKLPGSVVAQLEDEHSAYMTMNHNNTNVITLGASILGEELILSIVEKYAFAKYESGRHKVRVDMLKKLLEKEKI